LTRAALLGAVLDHLRRWMLVARRGTLATRRRTGLARKPHHVAAPRDQGRRQVAELLAVHRPLVDPGMDLPVARALADLLQTMAGRLVARPRTVAACLQAIFVGLIQMAVFPGDRPGVGSRKRRQSHRTGAQDTQQFTAFHGGLLWSMTYASIRGMR